MIDFRYHIVSLGAVFIALAIGIILGAGPLQNAIGEKLSGEVTSLREANNKLRDTNEQLEAKLETQIAAFSQAAPSLTKEALQAKNVAVVALPTATEVELTVVQESLQAAGAQVTGVVTLTEAWTSAENLAYRQALATQIKEYVSKAGEDTEANKILSLALAQIARLGVKDEANATLTELFVNAKTPLISLESGLETKAEAVVVVSGATADLAKEKDAQVVAAAELTTELFAQLASVVAQDLPTVLAGLAVTENDPVLLVRAKEAAVSTVDDLTSEVGKLNLILALTGELNDKVQHLGFAEGAQAMVGVKSELPAESESTENPSNTEN